MLSKTRRISTAVVDDAVAVPHITARDTNAQMNGRARQRMSGELDVTLLGPGSKRPGGSVGTPPSIPADMRATIGGRSMKHEDGKAREMR